MPSEEGGELVSGIKSRLRTALPKPFTATKLLLRYPWLVHMGPVFLEEFMGLAKLLAVDTGFERSFREGKCVDLAGNALPWLTYPAIWFLESIDMGGLTVFEYGAGSSSLFWARCGASHVRSVENDPEWVARVKQTNPSADIILETSRQLYPDVILRTDERWDIILVDGVNDPGDRYNCACAALNRIKPGGLIVLDDSNWLPETCAMLQSVRLDGDQFRRSSSTESSLPPDFCLLQGGVLLPSSEPSCSWRIGVSGCAQYREGNFRLQASGTERLVH